MKPLRLVSTPTRNRRLNEILGLAVLGCAVLLFLALATYTPTDPSADTVGGYARSRRRPGRAPGSATAGACPQLDWPDRRMAGGRHPADHRHCGVSAAHPSGAVGLVLDAAAARRLGDGPPARPRAVGGVCAGGHRAASAHALLAPCAAHRGRHRTPAGRRHGALPEPARRDHCAGTDGGDVAVSGHDLHVPHRAANGWRRTSPSCGGCTSAFRIGASGALSPRQRSKGWTSRSGRWRPQPASLPASANRAWSRPQSTWSANAPHRPPSRPRFWAVSSAGGDASAASRLPQRTRARRRTAGRSTRLGLAIHAAHQRGCASSDAAEHRCSRSRTVCRSAGRSRRAHSRLGPDRAIGPAGIAPGTSAAGARSLRLRLRGPLRFSPRAGSRADAAAGDLLRQARRRRHQASHHHAEVDSRLQIAAVLTALSLGRSRRGARAGTARRGPHAGAEVRRVRRRRPGYADQSRPRRHHLRVPAGCRREVLARDRAGRRSLPGDGRRVDPDRAHAGQIHRRHPGSQPRARDHLAARRGRVRVVRAEQEQAGHRPGQGHQRPHCHRRPGVHAARADRRARPARASPWPSMR